MKKILIIFLCSFLFIMNVKAENCSPYLSDLRLPGYEITPEFNKYQNTYTITLDRVENIANLEYVLESTIADINMRTIQNKYHSKSVIIELTCPDVSEEYELIINIKEANNVFQYQETISKSVDNNKIFSIVICGVFCLIVILGILIFHKRKVSNNK